VAHLRKYNITNQKGLKVLILENRDRTYYNASQELSIQVDTGANGIPSAVYVGPVYFEAFNNFPGSLWSFQANLANNASWGLDNTMEVCKRVMNTLKGNLIDFEIGNEVDLYPCAVRPCGYTVNDYLQEWTRYADAISENVLKGNPYGLDEQKFFQALVFANAQLNTFTTLAQRPMSCLEKPETNCNKGKMRSTEVSI
jgi:hypothetical protein